jgi:transcriptional regulator with XRE-family HTH domain
MDNPPTPGARLFAWRSARDPRVTLQSCADAVGVKHPTWLDWEKDNRSPSLEKALALELFTDGAIEIEAWGFDEETLATIRGVVRHRAAAERKAKRSAAEAA